MGAGGGGRRRSLPRWGSGRGHASATTAGLLRTGRRGELHRAVDLGLEPRERDVVGYLLALRHGVRLQSELGGDRDLAEADRDWARVGRILDLFSDEPVEALHARRLFDRDAPLFRHGLCDISWGDREDGLLARWVWLNEEVAAAIMGDAASLSHLCPGLVEVRPTERLGDLVLADDRKALLRRLLELLGRGGGAGAVGPSGPAGTLALFVGPTGAGKTLAARALAGEAGRPLLALEGGGGSQGRRRGTNLADRLEVAISRAYRDGAVLLVDECDRFFDLDGDGVMSEPELLPVLDGARGLVVLATNRAVRPDEALERRILYQVEFPIPCASERERIWRLHLPPGWPLAEREVEGLARRFVLTGGFVRNAVARVAQGEAEASGAPDPRALRAALEEAARHEEARLPWIRDAYLPVDGADYAGLDPEGEASAWVAEVAGLLRARPADPRLWRPLAAGGWERDLTDLAPWQRRLDLELATLRRVAAGAAAACVARGADRVAEEDLEAALRQVEAARAWRTDPPILGCDSARRCGR